MEKFHVCMIFLLFAGKLSRLYSNLKHLIRKKKFAGKPSRLEANPPKPRKFSTANDLHYTVCTCPGNIFYWFVVADKVTFKQDREFEVITVDCEGRWWTAMTQTPVNMERNPAGTIIICMPNFPCLHIARWRPCGKYPACGRERRRTGRGSFNTSPFQCNI